ncbi:MAG TPA: hypothetical protein EYP65_03535 [Armatimonadetes bacterium]|nr:hypothetical protein [Armatimonadota bacterium]
MSKAGFRHRLWALRLALTIGLASLPGLGGALSTLDFASVPLQGNRAAVLANGRVVFRLSAPSGWRAYRRARAVARVLRALSDDARFKPSFEVRTLKGLVTIWGGGRKIVTVTAFDAKAEGVSPLDLASLWVRALKEAFSLPHLSVSPERLTLGVGEWAKVWVRAVPRRVEVEVEPLKVASASVSPGGGAITIFGRSPGRATLRVRNEAAELTVLVEVKYRAAYLKEPPRAVVTSSTPSEEVLRLAALNAVLRAVAIRPGAKGEVLSVEILRKGRSRVLVPFLAKGPNYLDWRRELLVVPAVVPLSLPDPELLVVSNWPEKVTFPKTLLFHRLERGKAVRLLYHHLNAAGRTLEFSVDLLNPSDEVAEAQVVPACPKPAYSPLLTGHAAVVRYFRRRMRKDSFITEVGPRERRKVVRHTVRPGEVVSGILEVRLLSGAEATLALEAARPGEPWVEPLDGYEEAMEHTPYVYPEPIKVIRSTARVGERWQYLGIGEEPVRSATSEHALLGNYGVVYRFEITLENPLDKGAEVELLFYPRGGTAAGTFVINGVLKHFGAIPPKRMKRIASISVPAGSRRLVEVLTMPEPGSYYPASLVVKTTGVLVD